MRLASWFNQDRGIVTACKLMTGDLRSGAIEIDQVRAEMEAEVGEAGLTAFCEAHVVPDFETGVLGIAQASGVGELQVNTVMFGWSKRRERLASQLRLMRALANAGKSTIISRIQWAHEPGQEKRIDLWWGGLQNNGDLMLLLAHLLKMNAEWSGARLRICSIVDTEEEREKMTSSLRTLVPETRIHADIEVILRPKEVSAVEIMHHHSRGAAIVFLGLREPEPGAESEYAERLRGLAEGFNTNIFVRNAGEFAGLLVHHH